MNKTLMILANSFVGLYGFRKEIIAAFLENGYQVVIACPNDDCRKHDFFKELGCQMVDVVMERHGTNPLRDLSLIRQYQKILKAIKPLAVLTYTIKPNVYGGYAARRLNIPQLANITGLGDAIENPGIIQKISIFMYRWGLKKARKVYYQNCFIQEFCQKYHIGERGFLLPGSGVDLEWHSFRTYPSRDEKMKFNFIGRIVKDKGIEEYIEMASIIRKKYSQVEFHVIGECEGNYKERLRSSQEKGVLIWHDYVQDVRGYIKDSCCTILPSYHEGMANVLLETCAAGRPVIATNIYGCKEIIEEGVNGFLCKVRDSIDLAAKVEQFVLLPYEQKVQMGAAAREKVEREFDRIIVVAAYLNEIEGITIY